MDAELEFRAANVNSIHSREIFVQGRPLDRLRGANLLGGQFIDSITVSTSCSVTPRICATSAGPSSSGGRRRRSRLRLAGGEALLLKHLLSDGKANRHLRRHSARAAALHALRHLEPDVVVQVADGGHAGALVDRLLDLRRDRDVLDDEAGDLEATAATTGLISGSSASPSSV